MKLLGLKMKKPPAAQGPVTRDDAREAADRTDDLRRRRGALADQVTGPKGAEAGNGAATLLG